MTYQVSIGDSCPRFGPSLGGDTNIMATWIWIIIAIAAVVAIGLLAFFGFGVAGRRRVERRRAEARVLRQEADERTRRAEEREAVAGKIADEAREEREHAENLAQRAGKLDPSSARTGEEAEPADERRPLQRIFNR
jgi:flagellar biosynthesis/type III secretory pathway M-ring protein FliF/YscJ